MAEYERMPAGSPELGFVKIVKDGISCDYCDDAAVLQFRFRGPLRPPMQQAGCAAHAVEAAVGAYEESRED